MIKKLCLASKSLRRASILEKAGFSFFSYNPEIDESVLPDESPAELVKRLSKAKVEKAISFMEQSNSEQIVFLGADTVVVLDQRILGKPNSMVDAKKMLNDLSGRYHEVFTAITVSGGSQSFTEVVKTIVKFSTISDYDIERYCATNEPSDKAGAYAIQGFGGAFVESLEGSYTSVVGLPLYQTCRILALFKIQPNWK
tara:strand:- start:542 stop:1135 length:594 start_codon:yes stop_codon:yes gene_type:complete